MTRETVLVALLATAPVALVLIVALVRGYSVVIRMTRDEQRKGGYVMTGNSVAVIAVVALLLAVVALIIVLGY